MAEFRVKGVESIEFAPVSVDGSMPTTGYIKIVDIEEGSVSFNIPEPSLQKIYVEDKSGVWDVVGEEGDGASVTGKSLDLDPKKADLLFKGLTASTATDEFTAPIDSANVINLAVRITSKGRRGFKMIFNMPNAAIVARIENPLAKRGTEFLALGFTAEATAVTDASGAQLPPWSYKKEAVA